MKPRNGVLSLRRKRQVALLYHFASQEYLDALIPKVEELLAHAPGHPPVVSFKRNALRLLAQRASEIYGESGAYQCGRALSEFWVPCSPPVRLAFDRLFESVTRYCAPLDCTMARQPAWSDFALTRQWKEEEIRVPRLLPRTDVEVQTGERPPSTGVYVPVDDPFGTPQFAWVGDDHGALGECTTFNDLGVEAVQFVGLDALWFDGQKMLEFVQISRHLPELKSDSWYERSLKPELAPGLVAAHAFASRPTKWQYVEVIEGEWDDDASCLSTTRAAPDKPVTEL